MENNKKIDLPLSDWLAMCENNIFQYAKVQFSNSGITSDLRPIVMRNVLGRFNEEYIDTLINENVYLNNKLSETNDNLEDSNNADSN